MRHIKTLAFDANEASKKDSAIVRMTLALPRALSRNLDLLALKTGKTKTDILREAAAQYIETNNLDPFAEPELLTLAYRVSTPEHERKIDGDSGERGASGLEGRLGSERDAAMIADGADDEDLSGCDQNMVASATAGR